MTELSQMPGYLIRRLQRLAVADFTARMSAADLDLTPVQFGSLCVIADEPGIDQATLALRIDYDRATIGGVVDRLCQKGLVERAINPTDRRARVIVLTEPGRNLLAAAMPVVAAAQKDMLSELTQPEAETFLKLTRKILARADNR